MHLPHFWSEFLQINPDAVSALHKKTIILGHHYIKTKTFCHTTVYSNTYTAITSPVESTLPPNVVWTSIWSGLLQIFPGFSQYKSLRVSQSPVPEGLSRSNQGVQHFGPVIQEGRTLQFEFSAQISHFFKNWFLTPYHNSCLTLLKSQHLCTVNIVD